MHQPLSGMSSEPNIVKNGVALKDVDCAFFQPNSKSL